MNTLPLRLLITGGPGAGATTTAKFLASRYGIPHFDSDDFFHKPTDPPYQEQYLEKERNENLQSALGRDPHWILSGSISTWNCPGIQFNHGVLLDLPTDLRMERLRARERSRFGKKIGKGGELFEEHVRFMEWAAGYEEGSTDRRSLQLEQEFLRERCDHWLTVQQELPLESIAGLIEEFTSG